MATTLVNKIAICKFCKADLIFDQETEEYRLPWPNKYSFYYICSSAGKKPLGRSHQPMDNLDYIEHLAKLKHLV